MLGVSLLFVGITLMLNGCLTLQKVDPKSIAVMNVITAIVLIVGNFIGYTQAETMMDYCDVGGGFLFGFTYVLNACNMLFNIDTKVSGWYSLMVAIFSLVMTVFTFDSGLYGDAYLWFAWAILWGSTFVQEVLKRPLGKFIPYLCIFEGIFTAFIPSIMMFFGKW